MNDLVKQASKAKLLKQLKSLRTKAGNSKFNKAVNALHSTLEGAGVGGIAALVAGKKTKGKKKLAGRLGGMGKMAAKPVANPTPPPKAGPVPPWRQGQPTPPPRAINVSAQPQRGPSMGAPQPPTQFKPTAMQAHRANRVNQAKNAVGKVWRGMGNLTTGEGLRNFGRAMGGRGMPKPVGAKALSSMNAAQKVVRGNPPSSGIRAAGMVGKGLVRAVKQ